MKRALIIAAACLGLMSGRAQATVFYEFQQTSGSTGWLTDTVQAYGWVAFSDDAFTTGLNFSVTSKIETIATPINWNALGVVGLYFEFRRSDGMGFVISRTLSDLRNYTYEPPQLFPAWTLSFSSDPGGNPTGSVYYNDQMRSYGITFAGLNSSGHYEQDGGPFWSCGPSFVYGPCTFEGTFLQAELSPVPEPGAAGLFAVGLFAMGAIHRRRTRA